MIIKWKGQLGIILRHIKPKIDLRIDTDEQRTREVSKEVADRLKEDFGDLIEIKKKEEK